MKKSLNIIFMLLLMVILFKCDIVYAAKELICVYEGGMQNSPTMLIQDKNGNFSVKINYYGDGTDIHDSDWYAASKDHEYTFEFNSKYYQNGVLTQCPNYIQHPLFSSYKLTFSDEKTASFDYPLYAEYEGALDENDYGQDYDADEDYSDEIESTSWIGTCKYSDEGDSSEITLYFNREKMIFTTNSTLINTISAEFSLYELLDVYDEIKPSCPTLHAKNDCYASVGNTFCNIRYSLDKSFYNSDSDAPGEGSNVDVNNDPNHSDVDITPEELANCSLLLGNPDTNGSPAYYLSIVFSVIRYVAIILLIILTVMDFVGATASQDGDALKKATSKAIKRAILCVIIFILPTIIDFVLELLYKQDIRDCINLKI